MEAATQAIALPWWIQGVALAAFAAQVVALVLALKAWRKRPWAQPISRTRPAPGLRVPLVLVSVQLALFVAALAFAEPGRRALIAWGLGPPDPTLSYFELNPWNRYFVASHAALWVLPCALVATFALAFAISARWKTLATRSSRQPPRSIDVAVVCFSFFALALVPFVLGILTFDQRLEGTFEMSAGRAPGEKESLVVHGLGTATSALVAGARVGALGLAGAVLISVLFMRRWQRQGVLAPVQPGAWRRTLLGCVPMLLLAGCLFQLATPLRMENDTPWPSLAHDRTTRVWPALPVDSSDSDPRIALLRFARPGHYELEPLPYPLSEATAELERSSPTLTVSRESILVNGSATNESDLSEHLRDAMTSSHLIHPEDEQDHPLILNVTPDVPGRVLAARLNVAYETGFRRVALASGRIETILRPTLGWLSRVHLTSVPAKLERGVGNEDSESIARLRCRDFNRFSALLAAAVRYRRVGKEIHLDLASE